ncbi:MAG: glycosyl transferase family 2 [Bdellovibrionaceae bacterium]|nr:glycosyl transferase family 2 [Pseudobdellovibrionaceae bacterium]|tara:strand:+ start:9935 stop:10783 length:849 start_codon:yes stop_codon:yes gene_type:complete
MKPSVAIAYRVYPGISKKPLYYPDNKLKLVTLGLKSLKQGLKGVNFHFYAILDQCPESYESVILKEMGEDNTTILQASPSGNEATFTQQIEILLNQDFSSSVYFAEDDYLYLPESFKKMLDFQKKFEKIDFITPYNHPDYLDYDFQKIKREKIDYENIQWMTVASTCLTFLTSKDVLKRTQQQLKTYTQGNPDAGMWLTLTHEHLFNPLKWIKFKKKDWDSFTFIAKAWQMSPIQILFQKKHLLWAPSPTLATHLESTRIASEVPWDQYAKKWMQEVEKEIQ